MHHRWTMLIIAVIRQIYPYCQYSITAYGFHSMQACKGFCPINEFSLTSGVVYDSNSYLRLTSSKGSGHNGCWKTVCILIFQNVVDDLEQNGDEEETDSKAIEHLRCLVPVYKKSMNQHLNYGNHLKFGKQVKAQHIHSPWT